MSELSRPAFLVYYRICVMVPEPGRCAPVSCWSVTEVKSTFSPIPERVTAPLFVVLAIAASRWLLIYSHFICSRCLTAEGDAYHHSSS